MLTARPRNAEHPKIICDIQELTGKLQHEYSQTQTPINDDNHIFHRFCAKLEYLLQSCLKEKSFLGGQKNFWQWLYDSLKRQKGLKDGLRYVRANKELRTNVGRGRALIRYSLVHQTLGDSMQNCVMDESTCQRYLKPMCVLKVRPCADAFVVALYDLNDVLFDLNSQGFNLDSSWPTFASQHFSNQWHAPFRSNSFESLNSFATHQSLMSHPHFRPVRGSHIMNSSQAESSDPPSVDHRVEELVLELDQSDKKIREQQTVIERLEGEMEAMSRAGNESQDILAHVISERENRNQELSSAMERMTVEYERREKEWKEKYDDITNNSRTSETKIIELREKIVRLETDKRNLEETVSMKMTRITESFNSSHESGKEVLTPVQSSTPITFTSQPLLEAENQNLKTKLVEVESTCNLYQEKLNKLRTEKLEISKRFDAEKDNLKASLTAEFEEKMEAEVATNTRRSKDFFHAEMSSVIEFLNNFVTASDVRDDEPPNLQLNSTEYKNLLSSIISLKLRIRDLSERVVESDNRESEYESEYKNELEKLKVEATEMLEERELLENENAKLREQFHALNDELRSVKEQLSALQGSILNSDEARMLEADRKLQEKEEECAAMMQDLDKLRQEAELHEEETNRLILSMSDKDRKVTSCLSKIEELTEALQLTNAARSELMHDVEHKDDEITGMKEALINQAEVHKVALEEIHQQLKDKEEEFEKERGKMAEDFNKSSTKSHEMKEQIEHLQTENVNLKTTIASLSEDNQSVVTSQKELENHMHALKSERSSLISEVDALKTALSDFERETDELRSEHDNIVATLNDRLMDKRGDCLKMEESLKQSHEVEERLRGDVSDLQSIVEELKTRLIELLKEKDALWKESDELRYLHRLQEKGSAIGEAWMRDENVTNCVRCDTTFSFIVRKHHCRKCGKIFCANCCDNWIVNEEGKRDRHCAACFDLEKSKKELRELSDRSRSLSSNHDGETPGDSQFDEISEDECSATNTSIIVDEKTESHSVLRSNDFANGIVEESVTVLAGHVYRLPINVEVPGNTLWWKFTTDRSVDFEIMFYTEEGSEEHILVPMSRCESHAEAVEGEITVKQTGFYTLIFDNTFSRFMSKSINFQLQLNKETAS